MRKKDVKKIYYLYSKYCVDYSMLEQLDDEKILKGAKGILANLDLNKNRDYEQEDLNIIKEIFSLYC